MLAPCRGKPLDLRQAFPILPVDQQHRDDSDYKQQQACAVPESWDVQLQDMEAIVDVVHSMVLIGRRCLVRMSSTILRTQGMITSDRQRLFKRRHRAHGCPQVPELALW